MNEDDLEEIEKSLGRSLPPRYRAVILDNPLDPEDVNSRIALFADRRSILSWNGELLDGEFSSEWDADRFAIGRSPCGDTYFLDLSGASDSVFVWDHETHEVEEEAPDLVAFVSERKRWEEAARALERRRESGLRWWRFWQ